MLIFFRINPATGLVEADSEAHRFYLEAQEVEWIQSGSENISFPKVPSYFRLKLVIKIRSWQ